MSTVFYFAVWRPLGFQTFWTLFSCGIGFFYLREWPCGPVYKREVVVSMWRRGDSLEIQSNCREHLREIPSTVAFFQDLVIDHCPGSFLGSPPLPDPFPPLPFPPSPCTPFPPPPNVLQTVPLSHYPNHLCRLIHHKASCLSCLPFLCPFGSPSFCFI